MYVGGLIRVSNCGVVFTIQAWVSQLLCKQLPSHSYQYMFLPSEVLADSVAQVYMSKIKRNDTCSQAANHCALF